MPKWSYRLLNYEATGFGLGGRQLSPFVGRDRELELLQLRLSQVANGRGHAVGIVGEPGVGKSRLAFEFGRRLADKNVPCLQGRCVSHGAAIPYLPLVDLVRRAWRIAEFEGADLVSAAVLRGFADLGLDVEESQYVLSLLGVGDSTGKLATLSPDAVKRRTFDSLRKIILSHADREPIVLLLEDLHWIDQTSEGFLRSLVESLQGARILLVGTYRPGYVAPWTDRSYATQLALPPLAPEEGLLLVRSVLPNGEASEVMARQSVARADGTPVFLEELAWAAAGQANPNVHLAVPATVEAVLTSRMDRLSPNHCRVLETFSVLGREIPEWLLAAVSPGIDLRESISELVRLEFLYQRPGVGYVFKHALTQDVAYGRVLEGERQRLHAAAGLAFELYYADRLEVVYDRLAYHYARTTDTAKAIEYLLQFGQQATTRYALVEATVALEGARVLAERLTPVEDRDAKVLDAVMRTCLPGILLGRFAETQALLLSHVDKVHRLANPAIAGPYHFWLAGTYDHMGDHVRARQHASRSLEEARRCDDKSTTGRSQMVLTLSCLWTAEFRAGLEHSRQARDCLLKPEDRFFLAMAIWGQGWNHLLLGELDLAVGAGQETLSIGKAMEDRRFQALGISTVARVWVRREDPIKAIEACRKATDISPDPLATGVVLGVLGEAYLAASNASHARESLDRALDLVREFRFTFFEAWTLIHLSEVELTSGRALQARDRAHEAFATSETAGSPYLQALAQRALGRVAWTEGSLTEAAEYLRRAQDMLERIEARYDAGLTRLDVAAIEQAIGNSAGAAALLSRVRSDFVGLRLPHLVRRADHLLGEIGNS
jgi:tetratricopeptide (TPR) repeat protein